MNKIMRAAVGVAAIGLWMIWTRFGRKKVYYKLPYGE